MVEKRIVLDFLRVIRSGVNVDPCLFDGRCVVLECLFQMYGCRDLSEYVRRRSAGMCSIVDPCLLTTTATAKEFESERFVASAAMSSGYGAL
jgi:hypothetical protein